MALSSFWLKLIKAHEITVKMPLSQLLCFRHHGSSIDAVHLHDPESHRSQQPVELVHQANHCKRDAFVLIGIFYKLTETENTTKIVHHAGPAQHHTNKMQNPSQQVIGNHKAEATNQDRERRNCEGLTGPQKRGQKPKNDAKDSS